VICESNYGDPFHTYDFYRHNDDVWSPVRRGSGPHRYRRHNRYDYRRRQSINGAVYDIAATDFTFSGSGDATLDAHACNPCVPGQTTSFAGVLSSALHGTLTFHGRSFELGLSNAGGTLFLNAPVFELPRALGGPLLLTTPFSFEGIIRVEDRFVDGFELFQFSVAGTGRATGTFGVSVLPEGTFISSQDFTFDFGAAAPVPEPGSLLLLGTGLAGLILKAAGRRRRQV
jgi:hypothetical protein